MAGQAGLKPHEFWDITLGEFFCYYNGYSKGVDLQMDMLAWHASVVVQPWVKKGRVTPEKLRGKKSDKPTSGQQVLSELNANAEKKDQEAFWKKGKGRKWQRQSEE